MVVFLPKGMFRSIWAQVRRFYEGKWGWSPNGIMCRRIRACPWHVLSKTAGSVARRYQNQGMIDQTQSSIKLKHEYGHTFDTCHAVNTTGHNTSECTMRNFTSEHTRTYTMAHRNTSWHAISSQNTQNKLRTKIKQKMHNRAPAHHLQNPSLHVPTLSISNLSTSLPSPSRISPHPYSLHVLSLHIPTLSISHLSTSLLYPSPISPHPYTLSISNLSTSLPSPSLISPHPYSLHL